MLYLYLFAILLWCALLVYALTKFSTRLQVWLKVRLPRILPVASVVIAMFIVLAMSAFAQSVEISLDPSDLDMFFSWFNTMFDAIIPISLIGAGLVAGAGFAFVVGQMLKSAFQSLTGRG